MQASTDVSLVQETMMAGVAGAEGERLLKAFNQVHDPEARRVILSIVEAAAEGAVIVVEEDDTVAALQKGDLT